MSLHLRNWRRDSCRYMSKTTLKTTLKNTLKLFVFLELKKLVIKKREMSFLKIEDHNKRDEIVKEFLALKSKIKDNFRKERIGEIETQRDLAKLFKPITETQKATTKEITGELKPIKEGIENLPQAITFPAYPSIEAFEEPIEGEDVQYIGDIASKYLKKFATKDEADRTYGLYDKNKNFYIGNKLATIVDNDLFVGEDEYEGTPGLWELIFSKEPKVFTSDDYENYAKLMVKSNALHAGNNPQSKKPKSSKGYKWNVILKDIWRNRGLYEGEGVTIIPSDPNALVERLDLLLASQAAGHTGVGNELVSICDELKRQGVIGMDAYIKKKLAY